MALEESALLAAAKAVVDDHSGRYRLIYEPAVKRRRAVDGTEKAATLQYIDAVSGELIWRPDLKS